MQTGIVRRRDSVADIDISKQGNTGDDEMGMFPGLSWFVGGGAAVSRISKEIERLQSDIPLRRHPDFGGELVIGVLTGAVIGSAAAWGVDAAIIAGIQVGTVSGGVIGVLIAIVLALSPPAD